MPDPLSRRSVSLASRWRGLLVVAQIDDHALQAAQEKFVVRIKHFLKVTLRWHGAHGEPVVTDDVPYLGLEDGLRVAHMIRARSVSGWNAIWTMAAAA